MDRMRSLAVAGAVVVLAGVLASPAQATSMIRGGLDELVAGNETIVVAQVVDLRSYWNADHTFILSDVRLKPTSALKGDVGPLEFSITVMGGTVGDVTTVIVAGPELQRGSEYVLFLNREDLPGKSQVLTVRDLSQGVFEVVVGPEGKRAVSQAVLHPLLPDAKGLTQPPGGPDGLVLDDLIQNVRRIQ